MKSRDAYRGIPAGIIQETMDGARGGSAVRWENCQILGRSGGEEEAGTRQTDSPAWQLYGKGTNQATNMSNGFSGAGCGLASL